MADLTAIVPYHDPFDDFPCIDQSSFYAESPIINFADLLSSGDQNACSSGAQLDDTFDSEDPLSDPVLWELCYGSDENVTPNFEAGPSTSTHENGNFQNPISGNPMPPPSVFPVTQSPTNCICCQRLRLITHVNGISVKRLEIHGALGIVSHAVLEKYDLVSSSSQNNEAQLIDFCKDGIDTVKQFLVQYCEAREREGYTMLPDPLSTFYKVLSVGASEVNSSNDVIQLPPEIIGDVQMDQHKILPLPVAESNNVGSERIPLAVQRARTGNMKLKDFVAYFDLPIGVAAKKMNVCPTVLKKICRRENLERWPHRKIKSLHRKILKKTKNLVGRDAEERVRIQEEIQSHQQELNEIYRRFIH